MRDYLAGKLSRSASVHEQVAEHYGIPSICMALRVAELEKAGKLVFPAKADDPAHAGKICFAGDDCHPSDAGHALYSEVITEAIDNMRPEAQPFRHDLKPPLRADNWEQAKLVPVSPDMLTGSWHKLPTDKSLGQRFKDRMPEIWLGATSGDTLQFRFRGTMVRLYDLMGPDGGKVACTVDGEPVRSRERFDKYCTGHRLAAMRIAQDLEDEVHTVTVEVLPEQPDRSSVVDRARKKPGFKPERYDGTKLWVDYLMMLGDLVD